MSKFRYYDIRHLLTEYSDALYYIVIGERSNGKTYSSLDYCLQRAAKGEEFAYLRRYGEDIRPKNLSSLFDAHLKNNRIPELFPNYDSIEYTSGRFVLYKRDENGKRDASVEPKTIGRAFDLNGMEHYKSIAFPRITTIVFDEFLSRTGYIPNEWQLFQNSLSTIIRDRNNVKVLMLGNTVNKYCPYFDEMGLNHIKEMEQGSVDIYRYGDSGLELIVEYCESSAKRGGKASDIYFAFDNPQLRMITEGAWEIAVYPHLPVHYKPKDVVCQFFVDFAHEILHGRVISVPNEAPFVFLHRKSTEIQCDTDIVYCTVPSSNPYRRYGLYEQRDKLSTFIRECLRTGRVFYSTNDVGETFRNYLMWNREV